MAPTGTPVQYISANAEVFPAIVKKDHDEDCKDLIVFFETTPELRTSVIRGVEPGQWRLLPAVET